MKRSPYWRAAARLVPMPVADRVAGKIYGLKSWIRAITKPPRAPRPGPDRAPAGR
jgi:hypothetical protein